MVNEFNPYASPQIPAAPPPTAMGGYRVIPFQSGHTRALWAMAFLGLFVLTDLVGLLSSWSQHDLVDQMANGKEPNKADIEANDDRQNLISVCDLLLFVPTAIVFLMWTHRASRNLPALGGRDLQFTPGWAVGWFFVPFLNLVRPYQVMAEISRESDPHRATGGFGVAKRTAAIVGVWWSIFIARGIIWRVAQVLDDHGAQQTLDQLLILCKLVVVAFGVELVAALVAIFLVHGIDKNQQAKYDLLLNEPTLI